MKKRLLYVALILASLLPLVACGQVANDAPGDTPNPSTPENGTAVNDMAQKDFAGQTLSISVCFRQYYHLDNLVEMFKEIHPGVEIIINDYDNDLEKYKQQINMQLMTGKADDLLDAFAFDDTSVFESGLLADFYPLMQNDPDYNEEDYYMNVFESMAYDGKLYQVPALFIYDIVGVNNTFSPELVARFQQYDKITHRELFALYNVIGDKGGRYVSKDIDAVTALWVNFNAFVDLENKACSFNTPEFIELITAAKNSTNPEKIRNGELGYTSSSSLYTKKDLTEQARQYLFLVARSDNLEFFIPGALDETFTHFIPLVDENGKASLSPTKYFAISESSENKELAWEFVKFLTTTDASANLYGILANKTAFRLMAAIDLEDRIRFLREDGYSISMEAPEAVDYVIATLETYNVLPMTNKYISAGVMPDIYVPLLQSFYDGTMTAEQVASELQNKVSLYLME